MSSGNVLAFVGDAVLTLQVREYLVSQGITKTKELQELSVRFVSASSQAQFIKELQKEKVLTDEEIEIFKRGRNAKSQSIAKNTDVITYRIATGFEALWGFLYLNQRSERLNYLWSLYKEKVVI